MSIQKGVLLYVCLGIGVTVWYLNPTDVLVWTSDIFEFSKIKKTELLERSCQSLLREGHLKSENKWKPVGCQMHNYSLRDRRQCLQHIVPEGRRNHFVLLGDSHIRNFYYTFIGENIQKTTTDLHYKDEQSNLTVDFYWREYIANITVDFKRLLKKAPSERPSIIITGLGAWHMKATNGAEDGVYIYEEKLQSLKPLMDEVGKLTTILWMFVPKLNEALTERTEYNFLKNVNVLSYNAASDIILANTSVKVWKSGYLTGSSLVHLSPDGIHSSEVVLSLNSQILLNYYCNKHMDFKDGTCCTASEQKPQPKVT